MLFNDDYVLATHDEPLGNATVDSVSGQRFAGETIRVLVVDDDDDWVLRREHPRHEPLRIRVSGGHERVVPVGAEGYPVLPVHLLPEEACHLRVQPEALLELDLGHGRVEGS